jgi:hypothetical protein
MNKLAIVGSGPETRGDAPFDDPDYDIWVINEAPLDTWCKRWDAVFQLHIPELYSGHNIKHENYWLWMQEARGKPIYMQEIDPAVPDSARFPIEDAIELGGCNFFGQTAPYMLALAILQGYKHIDVYGVEMSFTEYQYGAASWRYWVGLAKGRLGADHVVLHSGQKLFTGLLYGYEGSFSFGKDFFEKRAAELEIARRKAKIDYERLYRIMRIDIRENNCQHFADQITTFENLATDCGLYEGAFGEARKYSGFGNRQSDRGEFEKAAAIAARDGDEQKTLMLHIGGQIELMWELWKGTEKDAKVNGNASRNLLNFLERLGSKAHETGLYQGQYSENMDYINRYDGMASALGKEIEPAIMPLPDVVQV